MPLRVIKGNYYLITLGFILCYSLVGCNSFDSHKVPKNESSSIYVKATPNAESLTPNNTALIRESGTTHLEQCNRDLESLRTVNSGEYNNYLAQYTALMKSSAGFMAVKDDVSPEVAELARPKFQFALVNLCYRIKNTLAQTLINQAGGTR